MNLRSRRHDRADRPVLIGGSVQQAQRLGRVLRALGDAAPDGPILGARVEHVGAKDALIADDPSVYFTTPHFDGYAAVLVRLDEIALDELEELIMEAWLCQAPKRLAREYLESHKPA